jgi:hypothetical protein
MEIKGIRKDNIAYRVRYGFCSLGDLYWNIYSIKNKIFDEKIYIGNWIIMSYGWVSFCI